MQWGVQKRPSKNWERSNWEKFPRNYSAHRAPSTGQKGLYCTWRRSARPRINSRSCPLRITSWRRIIREVQSMDLPRATWLLQSERFNSNRTEENICPITDRWHRDELSPWGIGSKVGRSSHCEKAGLRRGMGPVASQDWGITEVGALHKLWTSKRYKWRHLEEKKKEVCFVTAGMLEKSRQEKLETGHGWSSGGCVTRALGQQQKKLWEAQLQQTKTLHTAPRAFNTCHARNFSRVHPAQDVWGLLWSLRVVKVIPSHPCFVALCLTHLSPRHSLHRFLHLHLVRLPLFRCSILRRVHPLPLCKEG